VENKVLKIGCDLDETIFYIGQDILDDINQGLGTAYKLKDTTERSLRKSFNIDKEFSRKIVGKHIARLNLSLIKDARDVIRWLAQNHNINFITRRGNNVEEATIKLLDNNLSISYMLYMREDGEKYRIIQDQNIKVMIEDDADVVEDIIMTTDCIVLLIDKPWNRMLFQSERLIRVYSWREIKDYFIIKGYYG